MKYVYVYDTYPHNIIIHWIFIYILYHHILIYLSNIYNTEMSLSLDLREASKASCVRWLVRCPGGDQHTSWMDGFKEELAGNHTFY